MPIKDFQHPSPPSPPRRRVLGICLNMPIRQRAAEVDDAQHILADLRRRVDLRDVAVADYEVEVGLVGDLLFGSNSAKSLAHSVDSRVDKSHTSDAMNCSILRHSPSRAIND